MIRWHAMINYRVYTGSVAVEHDLEELSELDSLVELGPHWDTIISIHISRANHNTSPTLTVEEAAKQ